VPNPDERPFSWQLWVSLWFIPPISSVTQNLSSIYPSDYTKIRSDIQAQYERNIKSDILHKAVARDICPDGVDTHLVIAFNILGILEKYGILDFL
jgi:hypothetical protein